MVMCQGVFSYWFVGMGSEVLPLLKHWGIKPNPAYYRLSAEATFSRSDFSIALGVLSHINLHICHIQSALRP